MNELKDALKKLSKEITRYPKIFPNKLFSESVAGEEILLGVLELMNTIKTKQQYPKSFENVTWLLFTRKSLEKYLNIYRGVF